MFNRLFKKTQIEGDSHKIAILDRKMDLASLYYKLAVFYHSIFYDKLVEILSCVYGEYNNDVWHFLPPDDYLDDLYIKIKSAFERIDERPEFKGLRIVDFRGFPDLFGNHHQRIKTWEYLLKDYLEDKEMLKKRIIQEYPISNDVRVAFYDIDKLTTRHNKLKKDLLSGKDNKVIEYNEMYLNLRKGTLQFKDKKPIRILPSNQEIKLLLLLFKNKNMIVSYDDIGKELDLNSYNGEVTEEVMAAIKIIKNKLNKILIKARFRKNVIKSVRGSGYILNSIKLT